MLPHDGISRRSHEARASLNPRPLDDRRASGRSEPALSKKLAGDESEYERSQDDDHRRAMIRIAGASIFTAASPAIVSARCVRLTRKKSA